ncbi:MAG: nucleoside hydrolase [Erysipelotrichaceae bacterium]|jgi:pyrimidine-specific ribonucleoside hydrolase|nr:nucleoside hydrolase [Erysipelotrichaceae bacterium]
MDKIRKRPVILDGDPGHDDAIAWVLAAAADELDIKAITTVAGNQTLEKVTYNARRIAALLHLDIEVAKGRNRPLCSELIIAPNFHGETGLDGPVLPEPDHKLSDLSAPEMMAKVLRESEEKVTIISTGAQTNVAAMLLAYPELKEKIEMISTMGGGLRNGNWTAGAEFNILVDPEAAYNVYHSGVKLQMCGLDVTEKALVYPEDWERIRSLNNPIAKVVAEWFDFFFIHVSSLGWSGATTHDPCAVLSILHPEIFDIRDYYVDIELNGEYTRGATIADYTGRHSNEPNCACVVDLDREKFVDYLYEACSRYEGWEV